MPGAEKLDFRDVEAFGETTAYLLSAGPGDASRIYKTVDGGKSWALQFKSADPAAFFDAIAFWDEKNGIALGDPVKGQFQLIVTDDGGANWKPLAAKNLPPALPDEGAFAASGTCLVTHGDNDVWFATGGAKTARVFHSRDRGQNWEVSETPIVAGAESAGIFSIAFRDQAARHDRRRRLSQTQRHRRNRGDHRRRRQNLDSPRQAASLSLGRGLGERSLGRGRHVGLPCFPGQRRHLETARPRELQQRRLHLNR